MELLEESVRDVEVLVQAGGIGTLDKWATLLEVIKERTLLQEVSQSRQKAAVVLYTLL